jgi:fumarylacetoacetase
MELKANDPSRISFVTVKEDSDFPIQNLPFGVAFIDGNHQVVSAIGNQVVLLGRLNDLGYFDELEINPALFYNMYINDFMAMGKDFTRQVRDRLSDILLEGSEAEKDAADFLKPQSEVEMRLPVQVGDYTDFYSSKEHATNVGSMFRDPDNALLPNWRHLPVGYHGRASSIVVSGTEIHRPKGQTKPNEDEPPVFGPCKLLDFELEMAFVVGRPTQLGDSISTNEAEDYIFGMTLFNDWSARDIQKWEYVPLGPFLAKSFASTISPWIVTLDAFEPFRVEGPEQEPEVLPYLQYEGKKNYDLNLEVELTPENGEPNSICKSNYKYMYWAMVQQLAHHTVNGCNVNVGDMCASGTISGKDESSYGSMLELSWKGTKPIELSNGEERKFIADGDTITLKGFGQADGYRIGFGECSGKILPAK